jgi:glycosyltransferase involved in cell wall biosynthesis
LRLLHVIAGLSPEHGGPSENLRLLASGYATLGMEIEVLSQDAPGAAYLATYPFRVHAVGPETSTYGRNPLIDQWLAAHIHEFDGVVVEGLWQYNGPAVRRAARAAGKPYAVFTHGMLDPWFQKTYPFKYLKKYAYWLLTQYAVLRDAYRVLFTTELEAELAPTNFRPNRWSSAVVPLGTMRPAGDPAQQREAFYARCPGARGRRLLLFLGRIHVKKGCDLLIEAFASVAAAYPDLDLVIAGPDQTGMQAGLVDATRRLGIAERVHWPGMLEGDAKWGAFYASEAFILPSHQENFGIAIAEAIACRKPVLISNKINIWHYVSEDRVGFVEEDTVEGTRRLLQNWLSLGKEGKQALVDRTDACFDTRFSVENCARAIQEVFLEALRADSSAASARVPSQPDLPGPARR